MIAQLAFSLWIAAVTLAGIYFGQNSSFMSGDVMMVDGLPTRTGVVKTNLVAFPYISERGLVGYLMTRFTIRTNLAHEDTMDIPSDIIIFDALNRHFFAEAGKLSTPEGWTDLQRSMEALRQDINDSAGRDLAIAVLIEQLDFLGKDEVRTPTEVRSGDE